MQLKIPFYLLGFDSSRLFYTADEKGRGFLPVFTSAYRAEKYRKHFAEKVPGIQLFLASEPERAINLMECVALSDHTLEFVLINPIAGDTEPTEVFKIMEIIMDLVERYLRRRKGDNHHPPRTKADR